MGKEREKVKNKREARTAARPRGDPTGATDVYDDAPVPLAAVVRLEGVLPQHARDLLSRRDHGAPAVDAHGPVELLGRDPVRRAGEIDT